MDRYVMSGGKRLRCGYTTGSCAAAAAAAATEMLLFANRIAEIPISVPAGGEIIIPIADVHTGEGWASACVIKDSGDDPDITNGMPVVARATLSSRSGITIDGGKGVGRVTLPGLDQPVGNAAINSVPRRMIASEVKRVLDRYGEEVGVDILVTLPEGEVLARKTFNPRLGIVGGLSILGTSGIVEPMSEQALVDSIKVEVNMRAAQGRKTILITPGNYGKDYLTEVYNIDERSIIRCSNFIGEILDCAKSHDFEQIILAGHLGKTIKLAGNMFNTHSKYGDCRMDIFTAYAATQGISPHTARELLASATVDHAIDVLEKEIPIAPVLQSILQKAKNNIEARLQHTVELLMFTNVRGTLAKTEGFEAAIERFIGEERQ